MLDTIPLKFWTEKQKVFEPCSGKGGFLIDIIHKFQKHSKLTYKEIVEDCIYFSDINDTNIYINKLLLDPNNEYNLNYNLGDTLKLDIYDKWNLEGFDAVIGNPPYNASGNTGTGNTIWQHFTKEALNKWILKNGYLLYVHPSGWRKPNTKSGKFYGLFKLMTQENQMVYLSIHGLLDGKKTFNCGTRYDWYLIENTKKYKNTNINDENNINLDLDLCDFTWLPNSNIYKIMELLSTTNNCDILYSASAYDPRRKWMSNKEDDTFKYKCIQSTNKTGILYKYSSRNDNGLFNIPKVIFGFTGINDVIIDINGEFGMTQHAMGIRIESVEEGITLKNCLLSDEFQNLLKSCLFSQYIIDWNIFKEFKKDFYNYIN